MKLRRVLAFLSSHGRSLQPGYPHGPECQHCEMQLGKGLFVVVPRKGPVCVWCLRDHHPDYYAALVSFSRQRPPRAEQEGRP